MLVAVSTTKSDSTSKVYGSYTHENEKIGDVRSIYDGVLTANIRFNTFRNIHRLFPVSLVKSSNMPQTLPFAEVQLKDFVFSSQESFWDLSDYLSSNHVSGMLVIKDREIVFEKYLLGNNQHTRWMSMSVVKSMLATLVGVAIHEGAINSIDDLVIEYLPELKETAYDGVSIRYLLQMSSGVGWNEAYSNSHSDRRAMLEAQISQKSGAIMDVMSELKRVSQPGTRWNYSTGETQVVAALLSAAVKTSLAEYLSVKIWQPYGMESDASWWLDSLNGTEIGGSGLSATLRDYGRFGLYMLDEGKINGVDTLPKTWIEQATQAQKLNNNLVNYGFMWWLLEDQAYAAIGIYGQYIYIHPKNKTVIVLWSAQPKPVGTEVFDNLTVFKAISDYLQ